MMVAVADPVVAIAETTFVCWYAIDFALVASFECMPRLSPFSLTATGDPAGKEDE